jgi:serine/threonine protein kinase
MVDYCGQILGGRYRIIRLLGKGGMGAVYLGEHLVIHRPVAVKFLHSTFLGNKEVVKRFYREAQTAAALRHKNIIDVLDVGISDSDEPYLVMEYLEGESLASMLVRAGPVDLATACGIIESALMALSVAHENGVVHRDLKPDNIFLVPQKDELPWIKIIDFGVSKCTQNEEQTKLTREGSLLGTPSYMAPEQARGEVNLDQRTDLYAMGVILYEMLTGGLPFVGNNYNEILIKSLTDPPRPPQSVYAGFPPEAENVVMRALNKSPDERYQNTTEMLDALKNLKEYELRNERLTEFALSITKRTFAGGDLGPSIRESQEAVNVAKEALSEVASEVTPRGWARTTFDKASDQKKSPFRLVGWLLSALLVVGGIVATVFHLLYDDEKSPPVLSAAAPQVPMPKEEDTKPAPEDLGVLIEVKGAPEKAKIYFDNAEVPNNPFRVKRREMLISLRVEAEGYEPTRLFVKPMEDQVVPVSLKPSAVEQSKTSKASRQTTSKRNAKLQKTDKTTKTVSVPSKNMEITEKPTKKKFVKGGRGTEIAQDFE